MSPNNNSPVLSGGNNINHHGHAIDLAILNGGGNVDPNPMATRKMSSRSMNIFAQSSTRVKPTKAKNVKKLPSGIIARN